MDSSQVSYDVLAHFDRSAGRETTARTDVISVGSVLRWFAALATLFIAMSVLLRFGYCLAAELSLVRAARAGALEATLPRATYQSVLQSVERRLDEFSESQSDRLPFGPEIPSGLSLRVEDMAEGRFSLSQNGAPVRGMLQASEGDRFCVTLALPTSEVLPAWLRRACFWLADSQITVRAERQIPDRVFSAGL